MFLRETRSTHTSMNSFRLVAGVKTSRRPMTCETKNKNLRQLHNKKNNSQRLKLLLNRGWHCENTQFLGCCFFLTSMHQHLEQTEDTHIFMIHVLQQPQLSVCPLGMDDGLKRPRELLHGYLQTSLQISCRTDREGQMCA